MVRGRTTSISLSEFSRNFIGVNAWKSILIAQGVDPSKAEKYLKPLKAWEEKNKDFIFSPQEVQKRTENNQLLFLFLERANGFPIGVDFMERMGFQFSFAKADEITKKNAYESRFASSVLLLSRDIIPNSTEKDLETQREMIPNGFSPVPPLVEATKNVVSFVVGNAQLNQGMLARCSDDYFTHSVVAIGGMPNTTLSVTKKIIWYADHQKENRYAGMSCMKILDVLK